jgi:hypothetical protein
MLDPYEIQIVRVKHTACTGIVVPEDVIITNLACIIIFGFILNEPGTERDWMIPKWEINPKKPGFSRVL